MANWIRCAMRGVVVGSIVCGAMAGGGCRKTQAAAAAKMPPPLVNVAVAVERAAPLYLDEIGKAEATKTVTVMPEVAGLIDGIHFTDGADLKKGQLLFTIDARPFVAVQHQAEAQLQKDQAALANAQQFLKRQQDIYKQGFVAPSDYDTAVANAKAAAAGVEADNAAIEAAKLNVEYCTIKSPIDGRAGMRLVDPGNVVKINETALLVIQAIDPIYADFTINESDLAAVRSHMADHTLEALVRLPTDTDAGRAGSLTFLDNAVQDASGTIRLRATLANADRHFWPGQFVKVRLILQVMKDAVLIPSSAMQLSQQGPYVFVVKADSTAELRQVVLGQEQGSWVVVKSGVHAGEHVITNGQLLVFPGSTVNVVPAAPGAGPATQPAPDSTPTTAPATQTAPDSAPQTAPATQPAPTANAMQMPGAPMHALPYAANNEAALSVSGGLS
ncbi:MAG TPA: efflux RND transporter periplasmic adaptor subunit [Tepidisphaeraceae bacterium]|jgi:multidrug efflux system membrane fusion protein|nr:efflux RND transporter periplasmic adaptor subunit [Tepidisphaeraceae bacterium]